LCTAVAKGQFDSVTCGHKQFVISTANVSRELYDYIVYYDCVMDKVFESGFYSATQFEYHIYTYSN